MRQIVGKIVPSKLPYGPKSALVLPSSTAPNILIRGTLLLIFRYNPFLDQGVSRYEFLFHMRRHKRAAFFKIFLPPLFIALVVSNEHGEVERRKFALLWRCLFVCLFVVTGWFLF